MEEIKKTFTDNVNSDDSTDKLAKTVTEINTMMFFYPFK